MKIRYDICTANGCLLSGGDSDFLVAIMKAKNSKALLNTQLPHSRFRVQMFYPNGMRISSQDLKAALRSLSDPQVASLVLSRIRAAARASARRYEHGSAALQHVDFPVSVDRDFSQAGVVAPPDSPDLGNFDISASHQVLN